MGKGYNGKILRVDLTEEKTWIEEPGEEIYRTYLGGAGLAAYYIIKELPKGVDPLSPDNMLVLACSVITGTPVPGASRFTAAAKSPLTGAYGEAEAGGWWGPELKWAGFDAIIIKGKASKPVYLWIKDGEVEIRDAGKIWGMETGDSQDAIKEELDEEKVRILQIGPGGEKMVRYACLINELKHANGRTGMGAVMGSKNLKAIAVRGTNKIEMDDKESAREVIRWLRENYTWQTGDMHDMGTARLTPSLSENGILPTRNFREGAFEKAYDISGEKMKDTILVKRGTCYACSVACKREVEVNEGPYTVNRKYGGPEYETVASLGSLCGIGDLAAVSKGNELCNRYTLDTISTGVSIAFAMECYENGLLTKEDTGGIDLRFGNADAMVKMVEMIGKREGLGNLLAEGVRIAAQKIGNGAEKYAVHVKGEEVPMHEPRGKRSLVLAYSLSPTGADHMEAPHDVVYEMFNSEGQHPLAPMGLVEPVDTMEMGPQKVRAFYYAKQLFDFYNCIGMCDFVGVPIGPLAINQVVKHIEAVTGWNTSLWELLKAGERSNVMMRIFNFREGLTKEDDKLPDRLHQELESGALEGERIEEDKFEEMKKTYYRMAGWDDDGYPTEAKLEELGLEWIEEFV
ncbi:aldehyde ferredoxin oxidoreductase [Candidatus Poribacteria bacterium]|nr:aldehyde ferredoxin oxidoreductase [Candidatus Poribacteria bacterium]